MQMAGGASIRLAMTVAWLAVLGNFSVAVADEAASVAFKEAPGEVAITIGGQPFATYYHDDQTITRPYFAHVHAPGGRQVTRNHPPVEGKDLIDHGTFHPGIWMAFGDISGSDCWRLAAPVKHAGFVDKPAGGAGRGGFAVRNSYRDQKQPEKELCSEVCRFDVRVVPAGYLLLWDSTFSSDHEFYFGDQEEMGLGFRVATPLRAESKNKDAPDLPAGNGRILDSQGRENEDEIWGNAADWCDYSGTLDGQRVGMTIFCHPKNFRPSWFHARDYGLLEANPFGRAAFGKGEPSKVTIKPGDQMRLRYGVLVHGSPADAKADLDAAYKTYVELSAGD
jgi:hypothetical protein